MQLKVKSRKSKVESRKSKVEGRKSKVKSQKVELKINNKYLVFILFIVGLPFMAVSGNDFKSVDETTYRLYEEKKWDSLIVVGKQALRDNIDYYFLRMRLGIAFYSKTKYIPAAEHFRKATVFNSQDPVAWEYLYSSYVLANRNNEALAVVKMMPTGIQEKYKSNKKFVEMISFEGGPTFSSDNNKKNNLDIMSQPAPYGEQDLYGNNYYGQLGLLMNLSNRVNLKVAYNYLNFSKTKYFQYTQYENILDSVSRYPWGYVNNYHPPTLYSLEFPYHVRQQELNLESDIVLGNGFRIEPAVHFVKVNYNNITLKYSKKSIIDTLVFDSITPVFVTEAVKKENYSVIQNDTSFINYVISLGISKDFSVFNICLNGSFANLNNKKQFQVGGSFTFYPFGNLNFYGTSSATGFFQKKDKRLILAQSLGGKVFKKLWLEGNVIYGDLTNANIANGSIVYNNADKIDYRIGGNLIWLLSKHLELSLVYQYFQKESSTVYYLFDGTTLPSSTTMQIQNNKYHTNTIIIGIKWKL